MTTTTIIKCNKCDNGTLFILYDKTGLSYYQCSLCDNRRSKYEIENENNEKQEVKKQEEKQQFELNNSIEQLKKLYDNEVFGYDDLKSMIVDIADAHLKGQLDKPSHLLLVGASGTSKTFFFELMLKVFDKSIITLIDCSHLSSSGLVSYLNETKDHERLSFIILDELDKLDKKHQKALLVALESGILAEKKYKRNITLNVKDILFFATGNEKDRIYDPLLNRFTTLDIPAYSYEHYRQITDQWMARKCPNNTIEMLLILFPHNDPSEMIQIRTLKRLVDLSQCDPKKLANYLATIEKYTAAAAVS